MKLRPEADDTKMQNLMHPCINIMRRVSKCLFTLAV
jgi:hypothetical protein